MSDDSKNDIAGRKDCENTIVVFFFFRDTSVASNPCIKKKKYHILPEPKILCEVGTEAKEDQEGGGQDCEHLTFFPALNETQPAATEGSAGLCAPDSCSRMEDCPDIRTILQELHPGEKVQTGEGTGCSAAQEGVSVRPARRKGWGATCLNASTTPPHPVNIHNHNYLM